MEKDEIDKIKGDIKQSFIKSQETFVDAPEENREFLRKFSFICMLSFDIYVKKMLVEKLVDDLRETTEVKEEKEDKKEDKKEVKKEAKTEGKK